MEPPAPASATYRFPSGPNFSPRGYFNPLANGLTLGEGWAHTEEIKQKSMLATEMQLRAGERGTWTSRGCLAISRRVSHKIRWQLELRIVLSVFITLCGSLFAFWSLMSFVFGRTHRPR